MTQAPTTISRKTPQLYRDCLRLVQHIAGKSAKGNQLRLIVRNEFKKNAHVEDPQVVENLKCNAIRGLSNYLMLQSFNKDSKLKSKAAAFAQDASQQLKQQDIK